MKNIDHFLLSGTVERGFGRGASQLGCPTANLNLDSALIMDSFNNMTDGVYFGYCALESERVVRPCAASLGTNPTFGASNKKTLEIHILHKYENSFYGVRLSVALIGMIREMARFETVQSLLDQIHLDCSLCLSHSIINPPSQSIREFLLSIHS